MLEKDVHERNLRHTNLANSRPEDTQPKRLRWVYCCYSTISSRRGLTRVAYPDQGNARARVKDKREVEQLPRLSHFICSNYY